MASSKPEVSVIYRGPSLQCLDGIHRLSGEVQAQDSPDPDLCSFDITHVWP